MIAEEPRIIDLDADQWVHLVEILAPRPRRRPPMGLILLREGRAVKALHSERGAVLGFRMPDSGRLRDAARELGVKYLAACEIAALPAIFDAAERALHVGDDLVRQVFAMLNAGVAVAREHVRWYPRRPLRLRPLSYRRAHRLLQWLLPDGAHLCLAVFDRGRLFASLVVGKERGDLSLLSTLAAADAREGDADAWRDQVPALLAKVRERHGRVFLGLFLEKRTLEEMRAGRRPLRFLAEAHARGTAILRPFPLRCRALLWLTARLGLG